MRLEEGKILRSEQRGKLFSATYKLPPASFARRLINRPLGHYIYAQARGLEGAWTRSNELLSASLDQLREESELRYEFVRYLSYLIPTLGLIGTVLGIYAGLLEAPNCVGSSGDEASACLSETIRELGVAFTTTFLALVLSAIVTLATTIVQSFEAAVMNEMYEDCVEHMMNRLYEGE